MLIIVKWCTASSAHRGLPGWGGWEVLEGEGGKVRERWKVKGKRFNPPLSLKYFFLPLPPSCKDWEKSPWLWKRDSNNWLLARLKEPEGWWRRSLTFPCWKDFICRESQIWEKARDELANTHPTTHPANLVKKIGLLHFVAIVKTVNVAQMRNHVYNRPALVLLQFCFQKLKPILVNWTYTQVSCIVCVVIQIIWFSH